METVGASCARCPTTVQINILREIARWVTSMDRLLRLLLGKFIRRGSMTFVTASGARFTCGDGTGKPVQAHFLAHAAERQVLADPELALGEAYMDGTFVVERGTIADALAILMDQRDALPSWAKPQWWLRHLGRHFKRLNVRARARSNVAHHYDLDGRLYSLFLDADKQYSSAYFETPGTSLDDAQLAKKRHLAGQASAQKRRSRSRYRLGLGRARSLSRRGASGGERNLLLARAAGMSVVVRACTVRKIPVKCELPHRAPVAFALWCCDAHQDQPADVRSEGRPPH